MQNNKIAVVYYSMSGHSRRLATTLSSATGGALVELIAPSYQNGFWKYVRIAFDSVCRKSPKIDIDLESFSVFDRIILCAPVWASYPATPMRRFLTSQTDLPQQVALFLTSGDEAPASKAFSAAASDLGRPITVAANLPNKYKDTPEETRQISSFLEEFMGADANQSPLDGFHPQSQTRN